MCPCAGVGPAARGYSPQGVLRNGQLRGCRGLSTPGKKKRRIKETKRERNKEIMKERILFGLFFLQCARAKAFHPEIIFMYADGCRRQKKYK
jgi:hypothetical protein